MKKYFNHYSIYILFLVGSVINSCKGQVKSNSAQDSFYTKPGPVVIKKINSVALAPDFDTTLVSQYIRSIFQDAKGNLWFGTLGEGVARYDARANTLTYFSNPDGFIQNTVYAINEDKEGNLWFGTDQGVYKYSASRPDGRELSGFRNYNQKDGLNHLDITRKGILVDKAGGIWVGTHGGVYRYDPAADKKGAPSFSLFNELPAINVMGILEDSDGNIWFASSDQGVFRFDPATKGKRITNMKDKEGLGDNYAGGIAEDKAGNIWFVMKNGICKYDPSASKAGGNAFTEYTAKDGLGGTEFWGIYIEQSGIIWVTARGSTTRFDPTLDKSDPKAFTVFTPKDGINCCVQSMFQDRSGRMWWGAGSGLFRFNGNSFYQVKKHGPWQ